MFRTGGFILPHLEEMETMPMYTHVVQRLFFFTFLAFSSSSSTWFLRMVHVCCKEAVCASVLSKAMITAFKSSC